MSRKHFNAIALEFSLIECPKARKQACEAFIRVARVVNPNFQPERFRAACKVEG